jgi:uncharacterized OB-fold protein
MADPREPPAGPRPAQPAPVADAASAPYWAAARERRLVLQHCRDCRHVVHYPRAVCPYCLSEALDYAASAGTGAIYSLTVVNRPPPAFAGDAPYILVLVDLDEGVRVMSRLIDCPPDDARIGMRVEVGFVERQGQADGQNVVLPVFRPAPR